MTPGISASSGFFQAAATVQATKNSGTWKLQREAVLGRHRTRLQGAKIVLAYILSLKALMLRFERTWAGSDFGSGGVFVSPRDVIG